MNKLFVVCLKRYIRNPRVKGLLTSVRLLGESMMSGYGALRVGDSIVLLGIFRRYWIDQCTSRDKIRTNHLTSYVSKSLRMNYITLTSILKWDMSFHSLRIRIWESQSSDSLCDSEQGLLVKYKVVRMSWVTLWSSHRYEIHVQDCWNTIVVVVFWTTI